MDGWGWTGSGSTPGCLWKLLPLWPSPLSLQIFSMMLPAVLGFHWNLSFQVTHKMVWWSAGGADLPFSPPHGHLGTSGRHTSASLSILPRACLNTDSWAWPSVSDSIHLGWSLECAFYLFVFLREINIDSSVREGTFLHLSFFLKDVFIYFWLRWVLVAALREHGGYSSFVASHWGDFPCCWARALAQASAAVTWGLSCSSKWDLPGPGIEPVSPALAGRFLTTGPPGKPPEWAF